jgi:hypothetical protein
MVFVVEFADGKKIQVMANIALDARKLAVARFKDRLVLAVRPAGLLDMGYRRRSNQPQKLFN